MGIGFWKKETRSKTLLLVAITLCYIAFTIVLRRAVLLEATLMGGIITLCLLLPIGFGTLKKSWQLGIALVCVGLSIGLGVRNYPLIMSLTRDPKGVIYASTMENLTASADSVIMAPWGSNFFALAYAQRVENRMTQWKIVDHRADFQALTQNSHRVYTHFSSLYLFGVDWWAKRLGSPLRISSAESEIVMLTSAPLDSPTQTGIALGDGIVLDHWEVKNSETAKFNVVLYWTATQTPTINYSSFVHISDQETITKPEDLIGQSDFASPVYGWYPTTAWLPNELIREDHPVEIQPGRTPQTIVAGMYHRNEAGAFEQLGTITLRRQADGTWTAN